MNVIAKTIAKVFAFEFYRNNVMLFLLVLVLAAGFMRGIDHIILAQYFVQSLPLLLIPVSVWVAYTLFAVSFLRQAIALPQNSFLSSYCFFSNKDQWLNVFPASMIIMIPVHLYAMFIVTIGLQQDRQLSVAIIIVSVIVLSIAVAATLRKLMMKVVSEIRVPSMLLNFNRRFIRNYFVLILEGAIRRQAFAIAAYKIAGILLLFAVVKICEADQYDIRMPAIFALAAFALNVTFVLQHHTFQNQDFQIYRLMPYSLLTRYSHQLIIIILFTFPENLLLLRNVGPLYGIDDVSILILLGVSTTVLFQSYLYRKSGKPEESMSVFYLLCIGLFFAILASVPLLIIAAVNTGLSFWMFTSYYFRYEPSFNTETEKNKRI